MYHYQCLLVLEAHWLYSAKCIIGILWYHRGHLMLCICWRICTVCVNCVSSEATRLNNQGEGHHFITADLA